MCDKLVMTYGLGFGIAGTKGLIPKGLQGDGAINFLPTFDP